MNSNLINNFYKTLNLYKSLFYLEDEIEKMASWWEMKLNRGKPNPFLMCALNMGEDRDMDIMKIKKYNKEANKWMS